MRALDSLPRSITRSGYQGMRENIRAHELCREERGLPLHPANGFIDCPQCCGTGEHTRNDSAIGDPQSEYPVMCEACFGRGEIQDGLIDLLVLMAKYRAGRFTWAMSERRRAERLHQYRLFRARAMKRSSGLLIADERAAAQRRENEIDRAWAEWRAVA